MKFLIDKSPTHFDITLVFITNCKLLFILWSKGHRVLSYNYFRKEKTKSKIIDIAVNINISTFVSPLTVLIQLYFQANPGTKLKKLNKVWWLASISCDLPRSSCTTSCKSVVSSCICSRLAMVVIGRYWSESICDCRYVSLDRLSLQTQQT